MRPREAVLVLKWSIQGSDLNPGTIIVNQLDLLAKTMQTERWDPYYVIKVKKLKQSVSETYTIKCVLTHSKQYHTSVFVGSYLLFFPVLHHSKYICFIYLQEQFCSFVVQCSFAILRFTFQRVTVSHIFFSVILLEFL